MTDPLLPAVVDRLRTLGAPNRATLERVTIGDSVVMVELSGVQAATQVGEGPNGEESKSEHSNGGTTAGLAHRPPGPAPSTDGLDVSTLLDWAASAPAEGPKTPADRVSLSVAVAALNALSVPSTEWTAGDPMALLDANVETIATVGLFRPAFRKFDDVEVRVIERDAVGDVAAPEGVQVTVYGQSEASAALADAEVIFVTGSAFLYGGVERYLDAAPLTATVVVVGATASFLPDPLFDAGVDVVAGASVADADRARAAIRAGACGTDLHDAGVQKVYAVRGGSTASGLSLRRRANEDQRGLNP
ncbi:Rossmann-like domain-containing protein [Haloferax namakaokahaiae]|uniref:Rossmann-like domain-containing protein n=1 Tax=Haloferax namakaokahaiae TaxID=1748331 RepID=A0ABD5ZJB2_9EURY